MYPTVRSASRLGSGPVGSRRVVVTSEPWSVSQSVRHHVGEKRAVAREQKLPSVRAHRGVLRRRCGTRGVLHRCVRPDLRAASASASASASHSTTHGWMDLDLDYRDSMDGWIWIKRTNSPERDGLTTMDDGRKHAVIEGLKYMPSHEWAKAEGDVATVGITDHAQVRKTKRARGGSEGADGRETRERRGVRAIARALGRVKTRRRGFREDVRGDRSRWVGVDGGGVSKGWGSRDARGWFFLRDARRALARRLERANGERAIERGLTDVVRSAVSLST